MYKFSKRSLDMMKGVNEKLINLMKEAIKTSPYDFGITEGLRTKERQKELLAQKKTLTMNSRHLIGEAVDIMVYDEKGKVTWDFKYYKIVADHIKAVAKKMEITITWGGDWKNLVDGPHYQIEGDK